MCHLSFYIQLCQEMRGCYVNVLDSLDSLAGPFYDRSMCMHVDVPEINTCP